LVNSETRINFKHFHTRKVSILLRIRFLEAISSKIGGDSAALTQGQIFRGKSWGIPWVFPLCTLKIPTDFPHTCGENRWGKSVGFPIVNSKWGKPKVFPTLVGNPLGIPIVQMAPEWKPRTKFNVSLSNIYVMYCTYAYSEQDANMTN